jgi:hypothetical protein
MPCAKVCWWIGRGGFTSLSCYETTTPDPPLTNNNTQQATATAIIATISDTHKETKRAKTRASKEGEERGSDKRWKAPVIDERTRGRMYLTNPTKLYGKAQEKVLRQWYYTGLRETLRIDVEKQRNSRPKFFVKSQLFEAMKAIASTTNTVNGRTWVYAADQCLGKCRLKGCC